MNASSCSKSVMLSMEIGFEGDHGRREKGEGLEGLDYAMLRRGNLDE